jgi:hypothetical protein
MRRAAQANPARGQGGSLSLFGVLKATMKKRKKE